MNLREAISKCESEYIYVGERSGFIWIGTKEESEKEIPQLDDYHKNIRYPRGVESKKRYIERTNKRIDAVLDDIYRGTASVFWDSISKKDKWYSKKKKELISMQKSVIRMEEKLRLIRKFSRNYIPILEREVLKSYEQSNAKPQGTAFIISEAPEGWFPEGSFWLYSECVEWKNKHLKGERE